MSIEEFSSDYAEGMNELPEEVRWDLTLAFLYKLGQKLNEIAEYAVHNSRTTQEFDLSFQVRSNNEQLAVLLNSYIEEHIVEGE